MHTIVKRAAVALPLAAFAAATLAGCGEKEYEYRWEGATITDMEASLEDMEARWREGTDTPAEPAEVDDDARCYYLAEADPEGERRQLDGHVICGPYTPEGESEPVWDASEYFRTYDPGKGEGWAVYAETFHRADDPVVTEGFEPWRPDGKKAKGL